MLAALEDVVDVEDEVSVPLVPVGVDVTVPVPAVPAWLRRVEQVEAVAAACVVALPLKSQAVEALLSAR